MNNHCLLMSLVTLFELLDNDIDLLTSVAACPKGQRKRRGEFFWWRGSNEEILMLTCILTL